MDQAIQSPRQQRNPVKSTNQKKSAETFAFHYSRTKGRPKPTWKSRNQKIRRKRNSTRIITCTNSKSDSSHSTDFRRKFLLRNILMENE